MRLDGGLVGIADTRITSGTEVTLSRKVSIYQHERHAMFVMTSGLRSVRDKLVTYFDELIENSDEKFDRLYKAANAFGDQLRRVAGEDKAALQEVGLNFDIHVLLGGQLENDPHPELFLLYPPGNWIKIGEGTPYHIIGESGYGKPIIRRTLNYEDSLNHALKVGLLAFDSTRISAADVDYPIDVVVYRAGTYNMLHHRYEHNETQQVSNFWQEWLRNGVEQLPDDWMGPFAEGAARPSQRQPVSP
jgi:putative proteasome-type protease